MLIKDLFEKDIERFINGVVQAGDANAESVWVELDEFVITAEIRELFDSFFSKYGESLVKAYKGEKVGFWVAGFFGSGKSHFIKVLSYLLRNQEHKGVGPDQGEVRKALEFFEEKIDDALLFGEIKKAVEIPTDVILFNIDERADNADGRGAILSVFQKVLNELEGYSKDFPHIANMERHLSKAGKLEDFKKNYREKRDNEGEWEQERKKYLFHKDQLVEALEATLDQSKESCEKLVQGIEGDYTLTVQSFVECVKGYLDSKGPDQRIFFIADEVGQFIGRDTHLMLNLQTIVEELASVCRGRAWVVVTSQEDMDFVLGDFGSSKENDFSKIMGRFIPMKLTSANVDEVIQQRLLEKKEVAVPGLADLFSEKGDVLTNGLTFKDAKKTFPGFDSETFSRIYPFVPYQFQLMQMVFDSMRKTGAGGQHMARGARNLLNAFSEAPRSKVDQEVGALIPLYDFYESFENALEGVVKGTISEASGSPALESFDADILKVLFMIRYIDEMPGNVDNLVTLCTDEIDIDRRALREKIEESLQRLERESLINRNGDLYQFLTNEERDTEREIRSQVLNAGEEEKLLSELIFEDIFRGERKCRYRNGMDIDYNRKCDRHPVGNQKEEAESVSVITPLYDDYEAVKDPFSQMDLSTEQGGQVLVILEEDKKLGPDLQTYLKTDKYLRGRGQGSSGAGSKRILRDFGEANGARRNDLAKLMGKLLSEATYYVNGEKLDLDSSDPETLRDKAIESLIENTFNKMDFLTPVDEPRREIQSVLRSDDISSPDILELPEHNPRASKDLQEYIELSTQASRQIMLSELLDRYQRRPYGWPNDEVLLLLARLYDVTFIEFHKDGAAIKREDLYQVLTSSRNRGSVRIHQRVSAETDDVEAARELGRTLFGEMGPESEAPLYDFLSDKLTGWGVDLRSWEGITGSGRYPGGDKVAEGIHLVAAVQQAGTSKDFIDKFNEKKEGLTGYAADYRALKQFFTTQKPVWDDLLQATNRFRQNQRDLLRNEQSREALERMEVIRREAAPWEMIREVEGLIRAVDEVNNELLAVARKDAQGKVAAQVKDLKKEVKKAGGDKDLEEKVVNPTSNLQGLIKECGSLSEIQVSVGELDSLKDQAMQAITEFCSEPSPGSGGDEPGGPKPDFVPVEVVEPAALNSKSYLQTESDVNEYLETLRKRLEEAIAEGKRIDLR